MATIIIWQKSTKHQVNCTYEVDGHVQKMSTILVDYIIISRGGCSIIFQMTKWSCYCIVLYLEKVFVIGWRKEILWTRDGEGLTKRHDEGLH